MPSAAPTRVTTSSGLFMATGPPCELICDRLREITWYEQFGARWVPTDELVTDVQHRRTLVATLVAGPSLANTRPTSRSAYLLVNGESKRSEHPDGAGLAPLEVAGAK